ncbi:MAG: M18 family aminopeptidase [Muribaculaceae bacterium]|nr:M18 family aminopeptidase [Muribaculaceae bacterium]
MELPEHLKPTETEFQEATDIILTAQLMNWLDESRCNFLAVGVMIEELEENGFQPLDMTEEWHIEPGGKYYVVQNDTAIFAFIAGEALPGDAGFHIISSHSDSPGFKLKPNPEIYGDGGVVSLNVEKYGGGIMYTWFDRPLSMAARLMVRSENVMQPESIIVDLEDPVAIIPHLAIHFNRGVNEGNPLSVQKDMKPVIGNFSKEEFDELTKMGGVVKCMLADAAEVAPEDILGMEVIVYPIEKAKLAGVHNEYIVSGRLDDLSMAFSSLQALLTQSDTPTAATRVMAVFDNEETGSGTRQGAAAPTLRNILERITNSLHGDCNPENFMRAIAGSFMISADDAHAWHPNYNEKYDPTNHPVIGGGPVVKINANCKYMTDSRGDAIFRGLCEKAGVECQYFVNHGDVAGGSTLGNILTSQLDLAGVDMGCAIWGMHSACETAGVADHLATIRVFEEFYRQ